MTSLITSTLNESGLPALLGSFELSALDTDTVRWIQSKLALGGYLEPNGVDGMPGPKTHKALADFKADLWLEYPSLVGPSTINALAELNERQEVTEQAENLNQQVNASAGNREGRSAELPLVGLVFEHEYIVPGVPLTWGEMTKGLSAQRLPNAEPRNAGSYANAKEHVQNLQALAKVFGRVRAKFGSPIAVTSGYRPAALGIGVRDSQHIYGKAMDIYPLNGDFPRLLAIIKQEREIKGIGLGQRKGFLHIDTRTRVHDPSRVRDV
jgi:peptidoglycan hydrolase-like protein with peptidoglycan-binding domain